MTLGEAVAAREAAIAAVDANANKVWKLAYYACIVWCSRELDAFTTDDVRERMGERFPHLETHALSASGPLMRKAARRGLITKTRQMNMTRDKVRHRDLTVWYSLNRGD